MILESDVFPETKPVLQPYVEKRLDTVLSRYWINVYYYDDKPEELEGPWLDKRTAFNNILIKRRSFSQSEYRYTLAVSVHPTLGYHFHKIDLEKEIQNVSVQ